MAKTPLYLRGCPRCNLFKEIKTEFSKAKNGCCLAFCKTCFTQYNRDSPNKLSNNKKYRDELREEVILAYGAKCDCCGEEEFKFLTLDHINGDGAAHRKAVGTSNQVYRDVKRQRFPKDKYRILCYNCNCAIGHFGYCPHQKDKP